jgi:hypothetical protein
MKKNLFKVKTDVKSGSCKSTKYYRDEAKNALGSNKCLCDAECDGMRTCSPYGWCQGKSR